MAVSVYLIAEAGMNHDGSLGNAIRLAEVEHVFCPGLAPGEIVFADLTRDNPQFVTVTLDQVRHLNQNVAPIIR